MRTRENSRPSFARISACKGLVGAVLPLKRGPGMCPLAEPGPWLNSIPEMESASAPVTGACEERNFGGEDRIRRRADYEGEASR